MRTMPTTLVSAGGTSVPTISEDGFWTVLTRVANRPLTADERDLANRMVDHHWTVRVIAEKLFGETAAARYWAAN